MNQPRGRAFPLPGSPVISTGTSVCEKQFGLRPQRRVADWPRRNTIPPDCDFWLVHDGI